MEFKDIEACVCKGIPLPDKHDLTDRKCYFALRYLYCLYRHNAIDKDTAVKEKQAIKQSYLSEQSIDTLRLKCLSDIQCNLKKANDLTRKIIQCPDNLEMLELTLRCIDLLINDGGAFYTAAKRRMEENNGAECN